MNCLIVCSARRAGALMYSVCVLSIIGVEVSTCSMLGYDFKQIGHVEQKEQ